MRDVAVIGIGMTSFGELWETPLRSLWAEAALAALDDAGVDSVDLITIGHADARPLNGHGQVRAAFGQQFKRPVRGLFTGV